MLKETLFFWEAKLRFTLQGPQKETFKEQQLWWIVLKALLSYCNVSHFLPFQFFINYKAMPELEAPFALS